MVERFPASNVANEFFGPARFEADVIDCEVEGQIPSDMEGSFYRLGGEWLYPPRFPNDSVFNVDGYISMFRFSGGHVDYRGRFIKTERYEAQRAAKRQLFGCYRNPRADDAGLAIHNRTVMNTTPLAFNAKLFALKEDSRPFLINPHSLETLEEWDFDGGYDAPTFTAHPKIDPVSGELICFGYETEGEASNAVCLYSISPAGKVTWRLPITMPYLSMLHDMAITPNYIILPVYGMVSNKDWLEAGNVHWGWDGSLDTHIVVIPRGGSARDVRIFSGPPRAIVHIFNAYEENGSIIMDAPASDGNPFPFFPAMNGDRWNPLTANTTIRRYRMGLKNGVTQWQEEELFPQAPGHLGRIDDRFASLPNRYAFMEYYDASQPYSPAAGNKPGSIKNCYGSFDMQEGRMRSFFAGSEGSLQECCFVPRRPDGPEGDGYLIGIYSNFTDRRSELVIVDALAPDEGALARVILPFRLSSQVHGIWAPKSVIGF